MSDAALSSSAPLSVPGWIRAQAERFGDRTLLVLGDRRAVKYATANFVTVDINDSLDALAHQLEVSGEDLLWVTDGKGELHGVVTDLAKVSERTFRDL